ncbi:hypothetical protein LXA17_17615, partial [Erwinia amylovora]|nr:hypothetical protein [Erwinia amylovora]
MPEQPEFLPLVVVLRQPAVTSDGLGVGVLGSGRGGGWAWGLVGGGLRSAKPMLACRIWGVYVVLIRNRQFVVKFFFFVLGFFFFFF